jgi:hypothetical protein
MVVYKLNDGDRFTFFSGIKKAHWGMAHQGIVTVERP